MAGSEDKERRAHDRRLVCVVAEVEGTDKSSLALIRNISDTGALLLAARDIDVDEEVDLVIHTTSEADGRKLHARGQVVRREAMEPSKTDLWRWQLGVQFAEPLDATAEDLERITKLVKRISGETS